eukprot:m.32546 g.32546  ORF g.32546 m.32546 type:complete len:730 (-) comp4898_c0_seq1:218-2407(-)
MMLSIITMAAAATALSNVDEQWVKPQGLPDGHNGGTLERLTQPRGGKKPHLMFVLFDDYGWANAGWHRNYTAPGGEFVPATDEVATPNLNELVRSGINLNRAYVYKYCSPTRSAIQSGRNPYHVNPLNLDPTIANRSDPVSGFAAIPRNMTGIATKLSAAGYKTFAAGKWDAGMGTVDHTPHGRGYQGNINYFHHANDYWSSVTGQCKHAPPPGPPSPPATCHPHNGANFCLGGATNVPSTPAAPNPVWVDNNVACCGACSSTKRCTAWAFGLHQRPDGKYSCYLKTTTGPTNEGNCTSGCRYGPCAEDNTGVVDLWANTQGSDNEGPAHGLNGTCVGTNQSPDPGSNKYCTPGPQGDHRYDGYEDALFEEHVYNFVNQHDPSDPMFLFWAPHIVHAPLEVPPSYFEKFGMIAPTDREGSSRQLYHAMVNFADTAVGNVTSLLRSKGMWDDLVIVFSTDNGGPIYANGTAGANNYPLKGGKMNNWEGGIRGNSFVSGGFLAPSVQGTVYEGLVTAWDWYHTFCALAGVDPTDNRAALANLPPIDSYDHSGLILGTSMTSPRTELPIGTEPRPSNLSNAPMCSSYMQTEYYGDARLGGADKAAPPPTEGRCTTVSGLIVDEGESGLWKLLTGDVQQDIYTGPHYPNSSTNEVSQNFVGHCGDGCLFELRSDPLEANDVAAANPERVASMRKKLMAYEDTAFNPHRGTDDPMACELAMGKYGGFWGPFVFP